MNNEVEFNANEENNIVLNTSIDQVLRNNNMRNYQHEFLDENFDNLQNSNMENLQNFQRQQEERNQNDNHNNASYTDHIIVENNENENNRNTNNNLDEVNLKKELILSNNANKYFLLNEESELSSIMLIKNPNNEISIGHCPDMNIIKDEKNKETKIDEDLCVNKDIVKVDLFSQFLDFSTLIKCRHNDNLKSLEKQTEKIDVKNTSCFKMNENKSCQDLNNIPDFKENNSIFSEKIITYQSYGNSPIDSNLQSLRQLGFFNPISTQTYFSYKVEQLLIKYTIIILSLITIVLDIRNFRSRVSHQDDIITDLRVIHIQMDDSQLYQIFWSFMIVYSLSTVGYFIFLIIAMVKDNFTFIKLTFRMLMFGLIYLSIEVIIKKWDVVLMLLRFILAFLIRKWMSINFLIVQAIIINPEYRNISLYPRFFSLENSVE